MRLIALFVLSILPLINCFSQNKELAKVEESVFVDPRDNNAYKIIKIGTQLWFAENFGYLPQVDTMNVSVYGYKGTSTLEAKSTLSYKKFGALYSWEFAKKMAPAGWRLPSDKDWQQLEREIGIGKEFLNTIGWRGTDNEVIHLKPNGKTGFNIVFGGWRTDYGEFKFQGQHANFWCADSFDSKRALERLFGVKNQKVGRDYGNKGCGFSVRYVKNVEQKK